MACHFIDSDTMSGNSDIMRDSSKSVSIKILTNMKVIYSDVKSGTIIISTSFCNLSINVAQV